MASNPLRNAWATLAVREAFNIDVLLRCGCVWVGGGRGVNGAQKTSELMTKSRLSSNLIQRISDSTQRKATCPSAVTDRRSAGQKQFDTWRISAGFANRATDLLRDKRPKDGIELKAGRALAISGANLGTTAQATGELAQT